VRHRQLVKPLSGSDEWTEYDGTCSARTHFDGAISIDEMQFPTKGSFGMSLRLFDPVEQEWSVYWVSSTTYEVGPPVRGRWSDGSCWLIGEDEYDGRPVLASYAWSDITETTAHWEQSFSVDGGETWELNWTMDFTRRDTPPPRLDVPKVTGDFDFLVGEWDMHNRRRRPALGEPAEWYELESTMKVWSYFDGAISFDEGWFPSLVSRVGDCLTVGGVQVRASQGGEAASMRGSSWPLLQRREVRAWAPPTSRNHRHGTLGFRGATFRVYNPVQRTWSIHWINSQRGVLETPVIGSFDADGIGIFDGPDVWEGQPIDVRFRWTPGAEQASWEQSFSTDGGRTWVPNWQMTHTRTA
jgi:hypothetical protein